MCELSDVKSCSAAYLRTSGTTDKEVLSIVKGNPTTTSARSAADYGTFLSTVRKKPLCVWSPSQIASEIGCEFGLLVFIRWKHNIIAFITRSQVNSNKG